MFGRAPGGPATRAGSVALVTAGALFLTLLQGSAQADPRLDFKVRPVQKTDPVPGKDLGVETRASSETDRKPWRAPEIVWPKAGQTEVDVTTVPSGTSDARALTKAPGAPVELAASDARTGERKTVSGDAPDRLRLRMADRATAQKAGIDGVLMGVARADGEAATGRATVQLDYTSFRGAYGADWASRLRLVQLPACALTTPEKAACQVAEPLPTRNDTRTGTLTAEVDVAPDTAPGKATAATAESTPSGGNAAAATVAAAPASTMTVLAATAGGGGAGGDFKATSLSPSGSWAAGGNQGGFNWSYPLQVPPVPGDLTPKLGLGYSSSSIDGRTAASNNQSSTVGDGWSMELGFIERQYMACKDDNATGSNAGTKSGDLCWKSDNAVLSLNGSSSPLVKTGQGDVWRPADDDGSRVERIKGTATDTANGDEDNEYWKVTTTDGTQYFFGKNRLPGWAAGKTETKSTYTAPVFGNHADEPGHATAFKDSADTQAWRWNLDYVVDPHGNAMALFYDREANAYAKNSGGVTSTKPKADATYVRGGTLARIEYGHRAGQVYTASPAGKVVYGYGNRCLAATAADCAFDKAHAANWPDTPVDQLCVLGQDCLSGSPTFFSQYRLTSVTTQVLKAGVYTDIDVWTFTHQFPGVGDSGGPSLWLASIVRTGKAGRTAMAMPSVTFGGTLMANRVDGAEGRPPLNKYRITRISNETGADTLVTYSPTECTYGAAPDPVTNSKRCYPVWWTPENDNEPTKDWFHTYVVTKIVEDDKVAGAESSVTEYDYLGGVAWAKDTSEFTLEKHRTYSDFRGYGRVRTWTGTENRTLEETTYYRGIDGAEIVDVFDKVHTDAEPLSGTEVQSVTYDKDGGAPAEVAIGEPWTKETASMTRPGTTALKAYQVDTRAQSSSKLLSTGAWRTTRVTNTFDAYGQSLTSSDEGDIAVMGDESCTRTTHTTPDLTNWLISYVASVQKTSAVCSVPAAPANVVGEQRTWYDTSAFGAAPVAGKGNPTRIDELDRYDATGAPVFVTTSRVSYDAAGRRLEASDASGFKTITAYTPTSGAQPTVVTTTDAKGFVTKAELDGLRGLTLKATDANGRVTVQDYNGLGQLIAAWKPGRPVTSSADVTFTYGVTKTGPTTVTSKTLLESGAYRTAITLYDGMLRQRQSQTQAFGGTGRLVSDNFYDTHGRVVRSNGEYYNDKPVATTVQTVADNLVPSQTVTEYDGMGRATASVTLSKNVEKWRTTTSHGGNWTATVPPAGGTATLTVTNAHDKPVEVREYKGGNPVYTASPTAYEALKFGYDTSDRLTRLVDAAGNTWTMEYDLRGRKVKSKDPDKGTTKTTYTADDKVDTVTDGREQTVAYTYDELNRPTALYKDGVGGTKLASWTYDALAGGKGMLSSSTRYDNGHAYTTAVKGYDTAGRALGSVITVPAAEGKLQGTYEFSTTYSANTGLATTTTFPAAGGLPAETVRQSYTEYGLATSLSSGSTVYSLGNEYSPSGELLQTILGDIGGRTVQTFTFEDATRRLSTVINDREADGPQTIDNKLYTYDPAGNITRIRNERDDKAVTDTQCFTYDFAARLSHAWTGTDDCALKPSTGVRPHVGGLDPYWYSYAYDAVGNRSSEIRHDPFGDTAKDVTRSYAYPAPGETRPHAFDEVGIGGPGARTDSFEYDDSGNTTRRVTAAGDQSITWDAEGRMASSTTAGKKSTFLYDADGSRLLRRDPGAVTLYLGSMELKLDTLSSTVSALRYYTAGKATVIRSSSGSVSYQLGDHQGTNDVEVNSSTLGYERRDLGPFGTPRGTQPEAGKWTGDRGFVGGTNDASTGLTHIGAREYDSANGRFISVDPVLSTDDPQQINGYAYAGNSPVTDSDPSGEWAFGSIIKKLKKIVQYVRKVVAYVRKRAASWSYYAAKRAMWSKGPKGTKFGKFNVGKGEDRGIIMMRFFIHTKEAMNIPGLGYQLLGDNREHSLDPDQAYRMVLFWDTASGEVTFKVAPSHTLPGKRTISSYATGGAPMTIETPSRMIPANELLLNDYPSETILGNNVVNHNFGPMQSNSDKLDLGIHGVQSLFPLFAVDVRVTIAANRSTVEVTKKGDQYPDMEVVQYRRTQAPRAIVRDVMNDPSGLDSIPGNNDKGMRRWHSDYCVPGN
ncbi:RHS repeat domain-containing protein [Streptomyces sp. NPDC056222]|uniref:RHS repeat domain-containing protein n=1 Tax=Streptomyces sp. NPDC056222 TaxID=3345749 RepID=UPI0035E1B98D